MNDLYTTDSYWMLVIYTVRIPEGQSAPSSLLVEPQGFGGRPQSRPLVQFNKKSEGRGDFCPLNTTLHH